MLRLASICCFMLTVVLVIALSAGPSFARGGGCGSPCGVLGGPCGDTGSCGYQLVEKTIYVPQMVVESRTIQTCQYTPESRQRTVTFYRKVPETRTVERQVTVLVPEQRTRTINVTVCRPVWKEVTQHCTVPVLHTETRTVMRTVCRPVQVQQTRTVCQDRGHWEDRPASGGCGNHGHSKCNPCGGCGHCGGSAGHGGYGDGGGCGTVRVWVPQIVRSEVPVTVWKTQVVQEPYEQSFTVFRPEIRTRQVRVCNFQYEQQTREVTETVCIPTTQMKTFNVTTFRCVPEEKVVDYTVMVPQMVEKVVNVPVCKMVPKTITTKVPVCSSRGGCY